MDRMREIIDRVSKIPPPSQTVQKLMSTMSAPDHGIQEIIKIIENDGPLTAQVLKLVNSASFGLRNKVDSIRRAIMYVGTKTVLGIAIGLSAGTCYKGSLDGYESGPGGLWDHSLKTAIAARMLACYTDDKVPEYLAYTGGIIHDIGKSIISEYLRNTAASLVMGIDGQIYHDYLEAEEKAIGISHNEVGEMVSRKWNFPESLIAAIKFHHHPDLAPEEHRALVYCIHLGDFISMACGSGTGSDDFAYEFNSDYVHYIKVSKDELSFVILDVAQEFEKTRSALLDNGGANR